MPHPPRPSPRDPSSIAGSCRGWRGPSATYGRGWTRYDVTGAGRRIQGFVDELSNWYVRRSRRRFWNPGGHGGQDSVAAFHTLHECLVTTATLLAPFTPFVAEELWSNLAAGRAGRPDSVHLADYPRPHEAAIDPGLDEAMALARQVVELGRRIRTETRTRTRQPLPSASVHLVEPIRDRSEPSSTSWRRS